MRRLRKLLAALFGLITLTTATVAAERRVQVVLEFSDDCGQTWDGAWDRDTTVVQDTSLPLPYAYLILTDLQSDNNWNAHIIVGCSEAFDTIVAVEFPERRWRASTRYQP